MQADGAQWAKSVDTSVRSLISGKAVSHPSAHILVPSLEPRGAIRDVSRWVNFPARFVWGSGAHGWRVRRCEQAIKLDVLTSHNLVAEAS